ncbi:MAG: hypothetical protein ACE5KZ_01485 [Candidatus Scalinduaceae bacterium]
MGSAILPFFTRIVLIIFISIIFVKQECEARDKYKIIILPFRNNAQNNLSEMIPDVLRSTLTQTGYFEAVDREKIYEEIITVIPYDLIYIDNARRIRGGFTADQIDLIARLETKRIQKFGKKLRADYVVRGSISQIADSLRIDAEITDIKVNKMLGFISAGGKPEELLNGILKDLTEKITSFCRSLNAYDDALCIIGMYHQGQYTFGVTEKKLKELISINGDAVGVYAVLMTLYLSEVHSMENPLLEDKVIKAGGRILSLLNQNYDEKVLEIFLSSGFDPFDEIAKIYLKRGDNDKAIEIFKKAISIYPVNIAGHYKSLGMLYLKEGFEDMAIKAFEKSLDADNTSYELHYILASIFEKRNHPEKTHKHLEECIKYARNVEEIKVASEKINKLRE